jgi:hypothetical protein
MRAATSHNRRNHGAPFVDMAQLKLRKEIVVVAQQFLPRVGMCAPPRENESFCSGVAHSVDSGKNCCVVTPNVMRHRRQPVGRYVCLLGVFFGE